MFIINYQLKNTIGNIFQALLTIFLFLIIADIVILVLGSIFPFQHYNQYIVANFDLIVSILLIFFLAINFFFFENIKKYFPNLLIIILAVIPFEFIFLSIWGYDMGAGVYTVLYVFRILHLFALLYTLKLLGSNFISFSKQNGLGYGIIAITAIFIIGSVLFYIFEFNLNPNIVVFEDAIWFSLVSVTTTGYGDIVPFTLAGRVTAAFLIVSGVSFATFATASLASSIFQKFREEKVTRDKELDEQNKLLIEKFEKTRDELNEIKGMIKKLEK
ncbi:hypothetical protein MARBORIA2_05040 [Methanobrevibacter arboriphilus]|uniref:Uncharacterized protein n=1 Tax=Methanobrevibacter arboriphilus TaxID=39441 RepID=A0ACA8R2X0_METAZ|nr:potassium channel family protein [Methanobrevibacter arboriphilus]MCC7562595.1 potassium channel family protein [Methanobrevibacter arboriphilus]BBL61253.1 hypothetical protein MarbSA_02930 [Methanobrevibacter arboriphilus]GLI11414.1 hypothetical protein MARBORIA2_05040 [Methanobrevibacter arboriphilus]